MARALSPDVKKFIHSFNRGARRPKRWPCRCTKCGTRQTKTMRPDEYRSPVKCRSCKARDTLRIDWFRIVKEWGVKPCDPNRGGCGGYKFPRARGRGYCEHNKKLTADDLQHRAESGRY